VRAQCLDEADAQVVDPAHQRKGLGDALLTRVLAYVRAHAPPKPTVFLGADPPGVALYRRHGFVDMADRRELGMVLAGEWTMYPAAAS
jgi:GNAT superfamily N-acetyltransferase